jgi:hypothetical protein
MWRIAAPHLSAILGLVRQWVAKHHTPYVIHALVQKRPVDQADQQAGTIVARETRSL